MTDKTIGQLTAQTDVQTTDLLAIWRPSVGVMKSVQIGVLQASLQVALGATYLQVSQNLNDLADKAASRVNLGLGTAALLASTAVLQGANNLSDVANTVTSRSNLGLGTAAVANVGTASGTVAAGDDSRFGYIVPAGGLMMWPTSAAPTGYLLCNGQAVSRTTYAALFAVLGTVYGAGDGSTTFNVPNLTDRTPVGAGSTYAAGATGGSTSQTPAISVAGHALSLAELPSHDHGFVDNGHSHTATDAGHAHGVTSLKAPWNGVNNDVQSGAQGSQVSFSTATGFASISVSSNGANLSFSAQGSNSAHSHSATSSAIDVRQPYLGVFFIIKT